MNSITVPPNQRVLVTAGASGFGRAIADLLIDNGARAHVCDVFETFLKEFRRSHPAHGTSVRNISDETQVERLFAGVRSTLGGLDALTHNAGIAGPTGAVDKIATADWRRTIDICLVGQFLCTRLAVPLLKRAVGGTIVSMSSPASRFGYAYWSPYSTAGWGVIGFIRAWPRNSARRTSRSTPFYQAPSQGREWRASSVTGPPRSAFPARRWNGSISTASRFAA